MIYSIRTWLMSSYLGLIIICAIVFYYFQEDQKKIKLYEMIMLSIKQGQVCLLESERIKEDIFISNMVTDEFYLDKQSLNERLFGNYIRQSIGYFLKSQSLFRKISGNNARELRAIAVDIKYNLSLFKKIMHLYKLKGYKEFGYEGLMRENAHAILNFPDKDIRYFALSLRRHEKDFLIRKEQLYIHKFSDGIKKITECVINNPSISNASKNYLLRNIYYYNRFFRIIAFIENKIGIKGKNGLHNQSKLNFDKIINSIRQVDMDLVKQQKEHLRLAGFNGLMFFMGITLLIVLSIILVSNSISSSVNMVISDFHKYKSAGFDINKMNNRRSPIKEFNQISQAFVELAGEINIYTNFFKLKVKERTLEIESQKEEIIAQQKQIEKQYTDLLTASNILQEQTAALNRKNNDINDSIRYAKRIQKALITKHNVLSNFVKESFVLSKARDQVSGDFFQAYPITTNDSTQLLLLAADCTGHGVPGAFLSVLGINSINKIVNCLKLYDPGEILTELDLDFHNLLTNGKKEKDIVLDGMEIAALNYNPNSMMLSYCVARYHMLFLRDGKPIELIVNPNSIGYSFFKDKNKDFVSHAIQIMQGDLLYLFSDGFQDQFGGPLNKKYMKSKFRNFLISISDKNIDDQKYLISGEFKKWKSKRKQTDDVTVIGIKF